MKYSLVGRVKVNRKMRRMMITQGMVSTACAGGEWDFGNKVLYDLCRRYPRHINSSEVIAKIWLIGRGYAAALERVRERRDGISDFYLDVVAPEIIAAEIDNWLQPLRNRRLGKSSLPDVLTVHRKLTDLFSDMTGLNKRSLASKYLHFHFPKLFFIYDSRVVKALRTLSPMLARIERAMPGNEFDNEYRKVYAKCLDLRAKVSVNHGVVLTPRELDKLLLGPVLKRYGG
jgi:hypothetical protein